MGNVLNKKVNSIKDEYNGRRGRISANLDRDPPTTATRFDRKYIIVGGSKGKMKYPLPINAEEEKMWLKELHYFLVRHMCQNYFSSPVKSLLKRGARVLDVG